MVKPRESSSQIDIKDLPRISVIVATLNAAKTLQRCINSVNQQTYSHKELIVIDGGSTDETVQILKANHEQIAYWESEPDRGIYNAWNKGLVHTTGNWICFLGADDFFWKPDVLEQVVPYLTQSEGRFRVVYGKLGILTHQGHVKVYWGQPWPQERKRFFQGVMRLPHPGLFHHRSLFEERGGFNESFALCGDYELLLRELKHSQACYISGITVAGMQDEGSTHALKNRFKSLRELHRARRLHRIPGIPWSLGQAYLFNSLIWFLRTVWGESMVHSFRKIKNRGHKSQADYFPW